ncbi:MAG TPA: hypothetical protein VN772_02725 [Solirubrobacteraceae bacterium]|nr:hypothetical protein [Solirubrobacteraceae bacterium]
MAGPQTAGRSELDGQVEIGAGLLTHPVGAPVLVVDDVAVVVVAAAAVVVVVVVVLLVVVVAALLEVVVAALLELVIVVPLPVADQQPLVTPLVSVNVPDIELLSGEIVPVKEAVSPPWVVLSAIVSPLIEPLSSENVLPAVPVPLKEPLERSSLVTSQV